MNASIGRVARSRDALHQLLRRFHNVVGLGKREHAIARANARRCRVAGK
jgi:hypothetical protein